MKAILKHDVDFTIYEDGDVQSIIFLDKSDYFEKPSNPLLEIKFPSLSEIYSFQIIPQQLNVLTTKNLQFTNCKLDFPDGVYELKYSISPNNKVYKCIVYLKTSALECKIKELLKKDLSNETINLVYELDKYLVAAKELVTKERNYALDLFELVTNKLNKLNCGL